MVSRNKQAGFTLIEMMVVVVVIALLGAMIGPTLFKKVQQAERTRIAQDIRVIEGALKFYRLDNYRYPKQSQGLDALMTNPGGADNWNGPYLEKSHWIPGVKLTSTATRASTAKMLMSIRWGPMVSRAAKALMRIGATGI